MATSAAREPIDTTAVVETPEHVRFHYRVAGPALRGAAYAIDSFVRAALLVVVLLAALVGGALGEEGIDGVGSGVVLVALFVVEWGYYVLSETLMGGRSFGKRALGLRVVKQGGLPLTFGDSVLRNVLRAADFLPGFYAVGIAVMGVDSYFRRLGDMVAGTLVIVEKPTRVEGPVRIDPPPTPEELRHIPSRALAAEELEAIELLLRRIGRIGPGRELELAEMIAPLLSRRLGVRYRDPVRFLALLYYQEARVGS